MLSLPNAGPRMVPEHATLSISFRTALSIPDNAREEGGPSCEGPTRTGPLRYRRHHGGNDDDHQRGRAPRGLAAAVARRAPRELRLPLAGRGPGLLPRPAGRRPA